jgi:hypothetical protein
VDGCGVIMPLAVGRWLGVFALPHRRDERTGSVVSGHGRECIPRLAVELDEPGDAVGEQQDTACQRTDPPSAGPLLIR